MSGSKSFLGYPPDKLTQLVVVYIPLAVGGGVEVDAVDDTQQQLVLVGNLAHDVSQFLVQAGLVIGLQQPNVLSG